MAVSYETTARGYRVAYSVPEDFFTSDHCADCAAGGDAVCMEEGECPRCGCFRSYRDYECCESCDREWASALAEARERSAVEDGSSEWHDALDAAREQCFSCGAPSGSCGCHLPAEEEECDETPAPDLSEPVPGAEEEISGVHIVTLGDGRKVLSGNTFRFRDQIKAASLASPSGLAAGWDAAEKTWTVAAGTDLAFLRPPPPAPRKRPLPFRGACCADARKEIDDVCPQGPMKIVCGAGLHGSRKSDYEGS